MIRSMTGFGDAAGLHEGVRYSVEIRCVNNKFLKPVFRLPERLAVLEPWIEARLRERVTRGTVTVTVSCADVDESAMPSVNGAVLRRYVEQVAQATGRKASEVDATALVHLPGVLASGAGEEGRIERARAGLDPLLNRALDHVVSMRVREGLALREDLLSHHATITEVLGRVTELAPTVAQAYETRLRERLARLLREMEVTAQPADIVREVAVYAERTDIAEEIMRLGEHLRHFVELLAPEEARPVGRTLDFLSQELLREANTIASKSPDATIARMIVDVKGAIDRIKEQVQNIE
jgi:uncharacterized protein (TIGR00255 family)